jgi:hypothetical protein
MAWQGLKLLVETASSYGVEYTERTEAEESSRKLVQQIAEKEMQTSSVEDYLRIEREWRTSPQETLVRDRDKIISALRTVGTTEISCISK